MMRMKHSVILRFFLLSAVIALSLGFMTFFGLRLVNETSTHEFRRHMALFLAQTIESGPYSNTIKKIHSHSGKPLVGTEVWILSDSGDILAKNSDNPPPVPWRELSKPSAIHEVTYHYKPFHLTPDLTLMRLDDQSEYQNKKNYILVHSRRRPSTLGVLLAQVSFILFVIGISVLFALGMIFAYLRKKSAEARSVLSRLGQGDLGARFHIQRIDEIGSLMADFNKMASEIEHLVNRITQIEVTRRNLLEELSHDLRTPLTSLKASIETLSDHLDEMPKAEQREFLNTSLSELSYFLHLLDDLFFIAEMNEPHYKKTTREINLLEAVDYEVRKRQSQDRRFSANEQKRIQWQFDNRLVSSSRINIVGDPILIQRLLNNALDNAVKYAESTVKVQIFTEDSFVQVLVEDDGPGISSEGAEKFGLRRTQRLGASGTQDRHSLGLGSVIIKTILALHRGNCKIESLNKMEAFDSKVPSGRGSRLTISLPTSR